MEKNPCHFILLVFYKISYKQKLSFFLYKTYFLNSLVIAKLFIRLTYYYTYKYMKNSL